MDGKVKDFFLATDRLFFLDDESSGDEAMAAFADGGK